MGQHRDQSSRLVVAEARRVDEKAHAWPRLYRALPHDRLTSATSDTSDPFASVHLPRYAAAEGADAVWTSVSPCSCARLKGNFCWEGRRFSWVNYPRQKHSSENNVRAYKRRQLHNCAIWSGHRVETLMHQSGNATRDVGVPS